MPFHFYLLPAMGAFIGWLTNMLAVGMLFRPYQPIKIPFVNYCFQGLLPKKQPEIARTIGQVVEKELVSLEDLVRRFAMPESRTGVQEALGPAMRRHLAERLPRFLPYPLKEAVGNLVGEMVAREVPSFINTLGGGLPVELRQRINIAGMVEEKINSLDFRGLEKLALRVAAPELRRIELLGAVLGFIIGLAELGLNLLFWE